jgi:hypothetical protein
MEKPGDGSFINVFHAEGSPHLAIAPNGLFFKLIPQSHFQYGIPLVFSNCFEAGGSLQ